MFWIPQQVWQEMHHIVKNLEAVIRFYQEMQRVKRLSTQLALGSCIHLHIDVRGMVLQTNLLVRVDTL